MPKKSRGASCVVRPAGASQSGENVADGAEERSKRRGRREDDEEEEEEVRGEARPGETVMKKYRHR